MKTHITIQTEAVVNVLVPIAQILSEIDLVDVLDWYKKDLDKQLFKNILNEALEE